MLICPFVLSGTSRWKNIEIFKALDALIQKSYFHLCAVFRAKWSNIPAVLSWKYGPFPGSWWMDNSIAHRFALISNKKVLMLKTLYWHHCRQLKLNGAQVPCYTLFELQQDDMVNATVPFWRKKGTFSKIGALCEAIDLHGGTFWTNTYWSLLPFSCTLCTQKTPLFKIRGLVWLLFLLCDHGVFGVRQTKGRFLAISLHTKW